MQYRDVRGYSEGVACGAFNAKNEMEGYVGFKPFVYNGSDPDGLTMYASSDEVSSFCKEGSQKRLAVLEAGLAKRKQFLDEQRERIHAGCEGSKDLGCLRVVVRAQAMLKAVGDTFSIEEKIRQERARVKAKP